MGWLRDLMARSTPPIASLGELARLSLAHRDWPDRSRIQERSLSALFSKLDRGQELDWLRDRPEEQVVIAEILRLPLLDLKTQLGEKPGTVDVRRMRLWDVRFARELDLAREDLPPGLPPELTARTEWSPLVWVTSDGAGRGLVGKWLTARGLAHFCPVSQTTELRKLPTRGALLLDLDPRVELDEADFEELRVSQRPVCFAARQGQLRVLPPGARIVHSPPASAYLSPLIDWVRERLAADSNLDPDRAEAWIRRQLGADSSLGELLGMIGLADELPYPELHRLNLEAALKKLLERRLREANPAESAPARFAAVAFDALTEAAARTLVDTGLSLPSALPLDSWSRLLDSRAAELADPVWLESALRGVDLSAKELKRIQSALPPRGHKLARALVAASLLHPSSSNESNGEDVYALTPYCLLPVLRKRAAREALGLSPSAWGQGLLRELPGKGESPLQGELELLASEENFSAHEELLESFDESLPEHGAALEAALESLGISTLHGHSVPEELALETLRSFRRVGVYLEGLWEPRFRPVGRFSAALLALVEHHAAFPPALDPLRSERSDALAPWIPRIVSWLPTESDGKLQGAVWALLFRLSVASSHETLIDDHPVLRLLRAASIGRPELASLEVLQRVPWTVLTSALESLEMPPRTLFVDAWNVLRSLPPSEIPGWVEELTDKAGDHLEAFFRAAPDAVLAALEPRLIPFEHLLPHQLDALADMTPAPLSRAIALHCPLTTAQRCVQRSGLGAFSLEALTTLAARFPIAFGRICLWRALTDGEADGLEALRRARTFHAVLDELPSSRDLVGLPEPVRDAVRRALLDEVRAPGAPSARETAYRILSELDRALWPLLKASSSIRVTRGPGDDGTQCPT